MVNEEFARRLCSNILLISNNLIAVSYIRQDYMQKQQFSKEFFSYIFLTINVRFSVGRIEDSMEKGFL
jgi:hypothetical protein